MGLIYRNHAEQGLLVLLKRDDAGAYKELFDRFWPLLHRFSWRMLGDSQDATDIVQDVFVILWEQRHRLDPSLRKDQGSSFSKNGVLDWILEERQRELCFEMRHRWFDLIRFGKADAYLGSFPEKEWQPTDKLFPIPQSERLLNPTLTQNEGYQQ